MISHEAIIVMSHESLFCLTPTAVDVQNPTNQLICYIIFTIYRSFVHPSWLAGFLSIRIICFHSLSQLSFPNSIFSSINHAQPKWQLVDRSSVIAGLKQCTPLLGTVCQSSIHLSWFHPPNSVVTQCQIPKKGSQTLTGTIKRLFKSSLFLMDKWSLPAFPFCTGCLRREHCERERSPRHCFRRVKGLPTSSNQEWRLQECRFD